MTDGSRRLSSRARMGARERLFYALVSPAAGRWLVSEAAAVRARASWSREQIEQLQMDRLRRVLRRAATDVPHYRQAFADCGFDVQRLNCLSDIEQLPVLTRDSLHRDFESLRDPGVPDSAVTCRSTGGTTGKPVKVILEKRHDLERMLVTHRLYSMMGRRVGEPTLLIAGSPIDFRRWQSWKERLKNRLMNVTVRSSFSLTPARLDEILAAWRSRRHRFVIAYASVFDVLSSHVERRGLQLPPAAIVPCAELVTIPQRERWRRSLNGTVFELYGSREMPSIAGESAEHDGLLVSDDLYYVEVTDDRGRRLPPGTPGLITITSLLEAAMPLVRYQLGDVGIILPGGGRQEVFSRLRITHGRVLDLIACPDGKVLPGEFFPHLFKEVSDVVERYQVVQDAPEHLTVSVVPCAGYSQGTTDYLRAKIAAQVGEMSIEFLLVDEIQSSASGKYRPTINKLPVELRPWQAGGPTTGTAVEHGKRQVR